tara:strand:- start:3700 stop:4104 length:405 start_codon:yes stop_codon:yes gene_type:complete
VNFSKKINLNSETNLDLTPIVDVVFNLLIFFALSLNFSEITSSLNIKLPKAKSSETLSEQQIIVSIEKNNKIYINDKFLFFDEVKNFLISQDSTKTIVIKADETIDHGYVVKIMDLIKSSGFEKIGIAVKRSDN